MVNDKFICNMCLGELKELTKDIYICQSCGKKHFINQQTKEEEIWLANANKTLRIGNFDDAYIEFTNIVTKYPKNYEAYFGLLLSKHGIIYVDDIIENKKVPTCYNITNNSLLEDDNYKKAIMYAPYEIKENYKILINQIEKIRKEWLEKASKEAPYDIFISFKQSDIENNISKTKDYYTCLELYHYLTYKCGLKVFFSPETLKNKISERYEPYIYNAINTSKVMIVYGQKAEYINSTWVKNEWVRYLKKIKDKEKLENSLVVCYENFDAYNLPNELKGLQALDASNKSFLETLKQHIEKVLLKYEDNIKIERKIITPNPIKPINQTIGNNISKSRELGVNFVESKDESIEKMISSSNLLLVTGDFDNASALIKNVLEKEPNNSNALFINFLIKQKIKSIKDLKDKLIQGDIIHNYVLEQLIEKIRKDKALEIIDALKDVIMNLLLSSQISAKELNILTLYKLVSSYEFSDKIQFNHRILDIVSKRHDSLIIFSYAIKLLDNSDVKKYIKYHQNLYDHITTINIELKDTEKFSSRYIESAFDVKVSSTKEFRIYLLDKILLVDNINSYAIFNMFDITSNSKYLERDLSNTSSNKYLLERLNFYINYYLNSCSNHYEEIIQYIPNNEEKLFITSVKNRYYAIKKFLSKKKEDYLFKTIIRYIEILRKNEHDSDEYKFETLIYSERCIDENDLIINGPMLNKLPNYLDIFMSFSEEYQKKILDIIKKQEQYKLDQEKKIKEEEELKQKKLEEEKKKKDEMETKNNHKTKVYNKNGILIILSLGFFVLMHLVLFVGLLFDSTYDIWQIYALWNMTNAIIQIICICMYKPEDEDDHWRKFMIGFLVFSIISFFIIIIN